MGLVNMKLSKTEAKEMTEPAMMDHPHYPWGLNLQLNDESMAKLKLEKLPEVGSKMTLVAVVNVERVSSNETQGGGKRQDMSLQITDMALEPYTEKKSSDEALYGGK